jgi:hypothetical protein
LVVYPKKSYIFLETKNFTLCNNFFTVTYSVLQVANYIAVDDFFVILGKIINVYPMDFELYHGDWSERSQQRGSLKDDGYR